MDQIVNTIRVESMTVEIIRDDESPDDLRGDDIDNGSLLFCWVRDEILGERPDKWWRFHDRSVLSLRSTHWKSWKEISLDIYTEFDPLVILPVNMSPDINVLYVPQGAFGREVAAFADSFDYGTDNRQVGFIFDHGNGLLCNELRQLHAELEEHRESMRMALAESIHPGDEYGPYAYDMDEIRKLGNRIPDQLFELVEIKKQQLLLRENYWRPYCDLAIRLSRQVEDYQSWRCGNVFRYVVRNAQGKQLEISESFFGRLGYSESERCGVEAAEHFIENGEEDE